MFRLIFIQLRMLTNLTVDELMKIFPQGNDDIIQSVGILNRQFLKTKQYTKLGFVVGNKSITIEQSDEAVKCSIGDLKNTDNLIQAW